VTILIAQIKYNLKSVLTITSFHYEAFMQRKTLVVGISILAVLIVMIALSFFFNRKTLNGAVITPALSAAEINLTDHHGNPFTMSSQRGKVVLLYFGYTNCPDECPLTMAHIKLALDGIGDRAKNVQVLMVSTDPARDTKDALKKFMGSFNPTFLGLTGSPEELQKVWKDYGVTVMDGGETHSTFLYVIDLAGNIRETLLPDSEPVDIAADVSLLLKGK
jgi:protein SCO1/2